MAFVRWIEPDPLPADAPVVHDDPLLSALLFRRGLLTADAAAAFLDRRSRPIPDPFRLPNMEAAVRRVCRAIEHGETIAIFGDYDADGVTSTALLVRALQMAVAPERINYRLPQRAEGYGLNEPGIVALAETGATLLIAVDCGSSDHVEVCRARALGLDVVILDHHQMADAGPEGAIIVSAKLPGAAIGDYADLSAVGVAFLLVAGLAREGCLSVDHSPEHDLLDLVALGTIGDVCPLGGINRTLVRDGLKRIRERPRPGLAALCRQARLDPTGLTSSAVAFKLVPRLNAAGRVGDPGVALDLLLTDDPIEAERLARSLEALNDERKLRGQAVLADAEQILRDRTDLDSRGLLIVAGEGWTGGVLGIAAAKLTEQFGRPVIVLNRDGDVSRGSARSIPGFDINAALAASSPLVREHGGHSQAAGLAVLSENIEALESQLSDAVKASPAVVPIAAELRPEVILPLDRLNLGTARLLEALEPHGMGNEAPLLLVHDARVRRYEAVGRDRTHLKLYVETGHGVAPVMAWSAAVRSGEILRASRLDLVVSLRVDRWAGQDRLEAIATDFRPSSLRL